MTLSFSALLPSRVQLLAIVLFWHEPGFPDSAKRESEVAQLLAGLDPAVYVVDSLPNLSAEVQVEEKTLSPMPESTTVPPVSVSIYSYPVQ